MMHPLITASQPCRNAVSLPAPHKRRPGSALRLLVAISTAFAAVVTMSHAEDRLGASPEELVRLKAINKTDKAVSLSDEALSKLMVGNWTTGRHDYVYRTDGTWQMLPIEPGGTSGTWKIQKKQLMEGKTARMILEASEKQFTLKNADGIYPYRYVKITAAEVEPAADSPSDTVLALLKWYLPVAFKIGADVIMDKRMDVYMESKALSAWRKEQQSEHGLGAVPFVGQDYDEAWANNFKVTKVETKGDKADVTVRYVAPKWTKNTKFSLIKTATGWRITHETPLD